MKLNNCPNVSGGFHWKVLSEISSDKIWHQVVMADWKDLNFEGPCGSDNITQLPGKAIQTGLDGMAWYGVVWYGMGGTDVPVSSTKTWALGQDLLNTPRVFCQTHLTGIFGVSKFLSHEVVSHEFMSV